MTLEEFDGILKKIDAGCNNGTPMFCTGPKHLVDEYWAYNFDGFMLCVVKFQADGTVLEWADVNEEDFLKSDKSKPYRTYPSVDAYITGMVKEMDGPNVHV